MPGHGALSVRRVELPEKVWRVALVGRGDKFSEITPEDALLASAGNRFDVAGGGVLYAATHVKGSFFETLAGKRVSARMAALVGTDPSEFMLPNSLPAAWREERRKFVVRAKNPAPFIDLEDAETRQFILEQIGETLEALGAKYLDVPEVTGMNRLVTREVARWAYSAQDSQGLFEYSGIRYVSKLAPQECWAIFQGTDVFVDEQQPIERSDPDMNEVARIFRLTIH